MATTKVLSSHTDAPFKGASPSFIPKLVTASSGITFSAPSFQTGYGTRSNSPVIGDAIENPQGHRYDLAVYRAPIDLKLTESSERRDFQIRPLKRNFNRIRTELELLDRVSLNTPVQIRDYALMKRKLYLDYGDNLNLQLAMMALKLSLFFNMNENKLRHIMTPYDYLKNSLANGATFADDLKKARGIATLSTFAVIRFTDLDEKITEFNRDNTSQFYIDPNRRYAYDDFFNEQYVLFFQDENVNDFEWAFQPIEDDEQAYEVFESLLTKLLHQYKVKGLESLTDDEKAAWVSDSTVFNSETVDRSGPGRNGIRKRVLEGVDNPFGRLTDEFRFRRSIIPVGPANFRDAWEPDVNTLWTIKSISSVMRPIVQKIPFSAMYDPTIAYRRKRFMRRRRGTLYLMLDYKKSGITINRKLLTIMGRALENEYPEVEEFRYIKHYDSLKVYDNGKWHTPIRGVGLGNMNELYTLMQCVFGLSMKEKYGTHSIFFNDDAVYELDPRYYRSQVMHIISFIKKTGLIVNLSKSVVSRNNIFCEEYLMEDNLDYSKKQLLVVPIAGSAFQTTTAQAKKFVYGVNRQLIGTGYRDLTIQFINILTKLYKAEFGKMDVYLPYHLGGYVDFSETNFSCLVEFILDPGSYLKTPNEQGQIPQIRRWSRYLLLKKKSGGGLLSSKARIAFRGKQVENPLKYIDPLKQVGGLSELVYNYAELQSPKEFEQTMDDLLNYRGLHNAKPRIKLGLELKEERRRRSLYRDFKRVNKHVRDVLGRDIYGLGQVLSLVRDVPDAPSYFGFPRCFVEKSSPLFYSNRDRMVSFVRDIDVGVSQTKIRRALSATLESVLLSRWNPGADPFVFYELWRRRKSGYLISDNKLPILQGNFYNLPKMFKAFCPNKRLFITELGLRLGRHPNTYKDIEISGSGLEMILLRDAFEVVLPPDLIGEWRRIKRDFQANLSEIRYIMSDVYLKERIEFKSFLKTVRELMESFSDESDQEHSEYEIDHDLFDFLDRIGEEELVQRMTGLEQTVDRLIDEESEWSYEAESLMDDDFADNIDFDIDVDDDSEESVTEVPLNEVRRLVRYYDEMTRTG
jgi:hypothetical protein